MTAKTEILTHLPRRHETELSPICVEVLQRIGFRDRLVADEPEPVNGDRWDRATWRLMKKHGAYWSTSLFAEEGETLPGHIASRYRRAFYRLVELKLVEPYSECGRRVTHAKLTQAGSDRAKQIESEQKNHGAD